jgi:hypothetical protein
MKRKVVKGSAITDHQVDNVISDYKLIKFEFSNKSITVVIEDDKVEPIIDRLTKW